MTTTKSPPVDRPPKPAPRRRKWRQFTVRSLLVIVTLAAVFFSWVAVKVREARLEREAAESLASELHYVKYNYHLTLDPERKPSYRAPGPRWVNSLIGENIFGAHVAGILYCRKTTTDDDLAKLDALPFLLLIGFSNTQITDAGLERLKQIKTLRAVCLVETRVTPEAVARFKKDRPDVEVVWPEYPQPQKE